MHRLFITALACLISVSVFGQSNHSPHVEVIVEEIDNNSLVEGSTYRVYAVLPSPQYSLYVVFADESHQAKILTTTTFFQHSLGGAFASEINPNKIKKYPSLNYDSWLTIGSENSLNTNDLSDIGIKTDDFERGWNISFSDGAWFVLPDDDNCYASESNKVLLMQITTTGELFGTLNFQGNVGELGNSWRAYNVEFSSNKSQLASGTSSEFKRPNENIRIRVTDQKIPINKVAVIGKESALCDGSKDDGQDLAELVEGDLLGIYGVVERKHLEEIINEQRLAMSGLILEDSDFAQAGCLAGAQGTVLTSYGCLQGKTKLQIKLVDCSTSDLYWSATGIDVPVFDLMDALRIELDK